MELTPSLHALVPWRSLPHAREGESEPERAGACHYISPVYVAGIYAALADHDSAFEWLGRGFEARDHWMIYLRADSVFDPLRSDPRFPRLLALVGP